MKTSIDLSKWDFREELLKEAVKCRHLKKATTIRDKIMVVINKYDAIIVNWESQLQNYERKSQALTAMKRGGIQYKGGMVFLKDIVRIDVEDDGSCLLQLSNGKDLKLGESFDFVYKELFFIP